MKRIWERFFERMSEQKTAKYHSDFKYWTFNCLNQRIGVFLGKLDRSENQGITQHKIEALDNLTQDKLLYEQKKLD